MDLAGMKRRDLQALCKRHGLPAGGTNADLVARLDAALSGATGAEKEEVAGVVARNGCLKQSSRDAADAKKKVTFAAVEQGQARRLRSRVIWSPIVAKAKGKSAQATSDSADAEDSISVEAGQNVPVRRSRRNSVSAAEAEEVGEVVAVDRKRKRKDQDNDEGVAVSAQVGVSCRVTRRSSLAGAAVLLPPAVAKKRGREKTAGGSDKLVAEAPDVQNSAKAEISARITRRSSLAGAAVLLPPAVEKKRGKGKTAGGSNKLVAEAPDVLNSAQVEISARITRRSSLAGAAVLLPPAVETKRGRGKTAGGSNKLVAEAPDVQNSSQAEISARVTRSRATAPVVVAPTIVENKRRRKTMDASMVEETRTTSQLENKTQPSRPLTCRHQQVSSSKEDKNHEQIAAPNKAPLLRRSGRKHSEDAEKQPTVKKPVKRPTRKSVVLAKQPVTKEPVRGLRRKSVVSDLPEKEKGLIAEKNMEAHQGRSNSTTSKERSSKRRRATTPEEAMSVKEANDDIIIKDATKDAHKATHEYNKESSSKVQEICQVNATREEFYSGQLSVKVALTDEICTAQNVPVVIPGSEYGDNANESSDKSKQPQEHCDNQAVDSHLSETRSGKLDQSTCIAGLVPHNCVSEDKALMSEDVLSIDFAAGYRQDQSPVSGEGRVGFEANASETGEKNLANVMSTGLHFENLHHDIDITAEEADKDFLPMASPIEEHGEKYVVSPVAVEKSAVWEASACESAENPLTGIFSDDLHTMQLQHDGDLLNKETSEASGAAPSISESDTNPEIQCNAEESIRSANLGKCPSLGCKGNLYPTSLHLEGAADDCILPVGNADKGCSSDGRPSSFGLELMFAEACKESYSKNIENTVVEIVGGNKPSAPGSVCLGDEDVQPSPYSKTLECKHKYGLPEETVLLPKNMGSLSSSEQSPFGLQSLFSQENIDESMGSATAHTKNRFDDSKYCHVKSALENTHVSEPYSLDDIVEGISKNTDSMQTSQQDNGMEEGISKNDDSMQTSQQDNGMEGLPETNFDEEQLLPVLSLDAKHTKEVINFEEVACEEDESKKLVLSEELKASSEKTNVNGPDGNAYGITDGVLSSALHTPANDNYETCLSSNTDVLHQGHHDQCRDDTEDIIEDASAKYMERGVVLLSGKERSNLKDGQLNSKLEGTKVVDSGLYFNKDIGNILDSRSVAGEITPSGSGLSKDSSKVFRQEILDGSSMGKSFDGSSTCGEKIVCRVDAIENPSISLVTTGNKHEGALFEEAAHTLKNYAGTCSSNPRELLMDLQSLFSKGNIKESNPHNGLAFPSAENSGDESINVEQRVKVHHGSDLSHLGSTDLLDELIGYSNAEVLHQSHNHEDRSNVDKVEQVVFESCTNDIVEATAAAECIENGLVLLPSEQRSNLNDAQLNPKLESPTSMGSGLNCDKYVCNTLANGSGVVVVGERTPGSGLPEDYAKDHYPRQGLLDSCSMESSLQVTIFREKIDSAVAGIGSPSSSLATPDYKYEGALSKEAVCRLKNYTGTPSVDPKHLIMELQSLHSVGSTEKPDLKDNLAFPSAENRRDEPIVWHVEELLGTHVSSEPDTYQHPCEDLSRHEEKASCMKGSLTSDQIDLADDAHLIERDSVDPIEVLCEEKVERKYTPTSDSDILQEKSYSNGHGICQSRSQKHIVEANSRLSSCGTGTKVLHQDHKEECNEHNKGKFSPKSLAESNISEEALVEGMESSIMLPLVSGTSEIPHELLNTMVSDESEELSFSCDKDPIENLCTGPEKGDLNSLPKDFHIDTCQKQEVPEVLSLPKSPEESAKFQCVSVSGSGPCQQRVNESASMHATYNIETINQDHEEYNQNNEDQTTPGVSASSVPEAVEIEIKQSEMEIGLIPAIEISVLAVPDEQPNSKLEGNEDQITLGIPASSVLKAAEIEQSKMEIGLIPAVETSVLPVPDEQSNSKLEGNEVDEHSCSYDKDFFILSDSESLRREASSLHKDDCMDLSSEDNHPNDLPAPRSPEPSAYFQNDNDSGSVGICQSSRRGGISELRAKLQSFKVSSTVKGSYIAMSAPRPKPGDSMSQSAIAAFRNIENTAAVKPGHPVKPNADGKDSSRRALQPISGRPREQ